MFLAIVFECFCKVDVDVFERGVPWSNVDWYVSGNRRQELRDSGCRFGSGDQPGHRDDRNQQDFQEHISLVSAPELT